MISKRKNYLHAYTFIHTYTHTHISHSINVKLEYTSTQLFTNIYHYIQSVSTCNLNITCIYIYNYDNLVVYIYLPMV